MIFECADAGLHLFPAAQVYSVDTQGEGLAQVAFHPYHPLLVCVDQIGFVRVVPYDAAPNANPKPVHSFHVSNGA